MKNLQTMIVTFFRVKLGREEVVPCDGRAEPLTIIGPSANYRSILRGDIIRMDEIEKRTIFNSLKQPGVSGEVHPVPTHMGDLEPGVRIKAYNPARDDIQAAMKSKLLTDRHEKLHTQTDPQERLPLLDCTHHRSHEAGFGKVGHTVLKSSYTGKNHGIGRLDRGRIAGDNSFNPGFLQSLLGASKVAHSVINNDYGRAFGMDRKVHSPSLPLVEGTPWTLGSRVTAWSRALEKALKIASAM